MNEPVPSILLCTTIVVGIATVLAEGVAFGKDIAILALEDCTVFMASFRQVLIAADLACAAATAVIAMFGDGLIAVIFVRGTFTAGDAHAVAAVNLMFAFQIPFYMIRRHARQGYFGPDQRHPLRGTGSDFSFNGLALPELRSLHR